MTSLNNLVKGLSFVLAMAISSHLEVRIQENLPTGGEKEGSRSKGNKNGAKLAKQGCGDQSLLIFSPFWGLHF